jgi:hypothetical protein
MAHAPRRLHQMGSGGSCVCPKCGARQPQATASGLRSGDPWRTSRTGRVAARPPLPSRAAGWRRSSAPGPAAAPWPRWRRPGFACWRPRRTGWTQPWKRCGRGRCASSERARPAAGTTARAGALPPLSRDTAGPLVIRRTRPQTSAPATYRRATSFSGRDEARHRSGRRGSARAGDAAERGRRSRRRWPGSDAPIA